MFGLSFTVLQKNTAGLSSKEEQIKTNFYLTNYIKNTD